MQNTKTITFNNEDAVYESSYKSNQMEFDVASPFDEYKLMISTFANQTFICLNIKDSLNLKRIIKLNKLYEKGDTNRVMINSYTLSNEACSQYILYFYIVPKEASNCKIEDSPILVKITQNLEDEKPIDTEVIIWIEKDEFNEVITV